MTSRVWTDVDFEKAGKQVGWLYLPHSITRSGYGHLTTPVAVLKNGKGPTVLLMGGNHGDEYEGQVALTKLIRSLDPARLQGRLIIVPQANAAAARAGVRVSPIDEGNLNRAFPGDPDGTPTFAMAHYYDSVLFPLCDAFIDIHSGGTSMNYLPFASFCLTGDAALDAKARALLAAFDAPLSVEWGAVDMRMAECAAGRRGVVSITGEFGGAGHVSTKGLAVVERGLLRSLAHLGVLVGLLSPAPSQSRAMVIPDHACYVFAAASGIFEPLVALGDEVKAGQPCGQLHNPADPLRAPIVTHFASDGLVVCLRQPALVEPGDCLAHVARDVA